MVNSIRPDQHRNGYFTNASELGDLDHKWSTDVHESPLQLVPYDETVYVNMGERIVAINSFDGSRRWEMEPATDGPIYGPLVTENLAVVTLQDAAKVIGIDREKGTIIWKIEPRELDHVMKLGADEDYWYILGIKNRLILPPTANIHAIERESRQTAWKKSVRPGMVPTVDKSSIYIFGYRGEGGTLVSVNKTNGKTRWEYQNPYNDSNPHIGIYEESLVYVGENSIICLSTDDGSVLWKTELGSRRPTQPVITDNYCCVVGTTNNQDRSSIHIFDRCSGVEQWSNETEYSVKQTSQPFATSQNIIIPSSNGKLFAYDFESGDQNWVLEVQGQVENPAWGVGTKNLYVGTGNQVYAFSQQSRRKTEVFVKEDIRYQNQAENQTNYCPNCRERLRQYSAPKYCPYCGFDLK